MTRNAAISAIVPARNEEATIAPAVESLAAQPEIAEIIVVNDQSTDRTARILEALRASVPKLRVLETQPPLPTGWVGKNHAVALGARQAAGDWLLFTDADAVHLAGSAARALADAAAAGAALVSYSPEQDMETWWERALVPFVYCRLALRFSFAEVSDPHSPAAAANGQYLLIHRDAYQAVGGHASVRGEVLEDVALGRRVKQAGYPISFALGQGIARVRMYRSFAHMWQGWTKNLYPLAGGSSAEVWRELVSVVPWVPVALLLASPVHRLLLLLGFLLLAGRHAAYATMLRRNQFPVSCVLLYLPAVLLYSLALLVSAWQYARGTVVWKGRAYPVGTPSK